jgi:hypothetical protein
MMVELAGAIVGFSKCPNRASNGCIVAGMRTSGKSPLSIE